MKRILFFIFLALFFNSAKSQIVMNEVSWTNYTQKDGFNQYSDYVEIYNATPGFSLSLDNYYLTNDPSNLYKWKFPTGINMGYKPNASAFMVVWLSGRNLLESAPVNPGPRFRYHTNFTIDQCKNQWLILSYNGVIKDSLFVRRTKPNDNWGRYPDYYLTPLSNTGWKLLQNGSISAPNFEASNSPFPPAQVYLGYAPVPTFSYGPGFTPPGSGNYTMWIPDTVNFQINYTMGECNILGGGIPCASYTGCIGTSSTAQTYTYVDDIVTPTPLTGLTTVITAVNYPKPNGVGSASLANLYLPSFEETNTYFDGADLSVNPGFGCLSMVTDTSFFRATGSKTLHVEYFDKNKFYSEAGGSLSQPPNDGWINQQRGFDVGFDDRTGEGCRLTGNIYNDGTFGVSTRTIFPNFEIRAAGKDNFSARTPTVASSTTLRTTHMRDAFAQTYAMKSGLSMEGLHYKPIRTYVNGCYWGIYEFREIPDQDYLNYYFGINRDSVDILRQHVVGSVIPPTPSRDTGWVTTPMAPGPSQSTVGVFNYATKLPIFLSPSIYYDNTMKRLSKCSFMDYFIYNSYLVNNDATALNTSWWRKINNGNHPAYADTLMKWRYFMWDMNDILGLPYALKDPLFPAVPMTFTASN
ncbi:MAG TPA: CotH kinase family protein, partial [Bacteroidia bacterium]|nr:CotH kinase family protein [Bacteroidia bacterium]